MPPKSLIFNPRYLPAWLLLGTLWLIAQLPFRLQMAVGSGLGLLAMAITPSRRRVVETNLSICFPEWDAAERRRQVKAHFRSTGQGIVEMGMCWFAPESRLAALTHFEGAEHIDKAHASGQGVILLSAHFTSLEVGGRLFVTRWPLAAMFRPHKNAVIAWAMQKFRGSVAENAIPRNDVRGMIKALKRGEMVWYAADQSKRFKYTAVVPFMGEPALTNTAAARFAKLANAKVVPWFTLRRSDGKGYDAIFLPELEGYAELSEEEGARVMNDVIETAVRRAPEQYLWTHKRFKNRGAEHPDPYGK